MMILRCVLALIVTGMTVVSWSALAAPRRADPVKTYDTDNDGTLDLMETKKAAAALFATLDRDHEGTLDARELRGRLSAKDLKAADPDHDGTLTLDEYLAIVAQRFDAANGDNDGTLDGKELTTPAGRKLLRLLRYCDYSVAADDRQAVGRILPYLIGRPIYLNDSVWSCVQSGAALASTSA